MSEMYLSQAELGKVLKSLRLNQTESPTLEGKEALELKSDGDRATFIRHVAALANTGQKAYFIIGVENKTWMPKGIVEDSPLKDADSTQQQMNQILANRLDPPLSVRYRTYLIGGTVIGAVEVEGKNPPYIISIEAPAYGGAKTKGNESLIYRGVIYVRRGADSVAANRQSEILQIPEGRRDILGILVSLAFIGVLVGAGVGTGASLIKFADPYVAAILGCVWGLAIGWASHKRLIEAFGTLPAGPFGKIVKNIAGPTWGAIIGMLISYWMIATILSGKAKAIDPVSMGFIVGPLMAFLAVIYVVILVVVVRRFFSTIRLAIDLLKQKAS